MKNYLWILLLLTSACSKPAVYGRERPVAPLTRIYAHPPAVTFPAAKKALTLLGYEVREENAAEGTLRTNWTSTKATSHYTELFDRKDFGTVGAYYKVEIVIRDRNGKSEVQVALPVKSLVAHQRSNTQEERRILRKIGDLLRPDDFEMTNLGTE